MTVVTVVTAVMDVVLIIQYEHLARSAVSIPWGNRTVRLTDNSL